MTPIDIPPHCPREIAERYARIRPEIHLFERAPSSIPGLTLSHWIDWEIWQRVRKYFFEAEEGDWLCCEEDATAIEEALEILPENRLAAMRARREAETACLVAS